MFIFFHLPLNAKLKLTLGVLGLSLLLRCDVLARPVCVSCVLRVVIQLQEVKRNGARTAKVPLPSSCGCHRPVRVPLPGPFARRIESCHGEANGVLTRAARSRTRREPHQLLLEPIIIRSLRVALGFFAMVDGDGGGDGPRVPFLRSRQRCVALQSLVCCSSSCFATSQRQNAVPCASTRLRSRESR